MELASKYNPTDVEAKWYQYWLDHKLFSSKPDGREPYTVVIPPPNVTGVLHMGHVLNETIQDILVRHARMQGKNACWVPGTDHASIATEAKVIKRLAEQGIQKSDLTREEFLKHAWAWTDEHGGIILKQLRKLGCSCDWDRTAFTMDESRSESVIKVFVDLYNKGLIYRGVRMVNWDPERQTALSDEEVIYHDEHSKLFYMKYYVDEPAGSTDGEEPNAIVICNNDKEFDPTVKQQVIHRDPQGRRYAVVATTRPETIMGDVAVCINPNDPKNTWLKGKKVIVPMVNRVVPIIQDEYVEIEFGTGCLKVTPAHDVNDYMLGEKYNLEAIDVFNPDGTLSEAAGLYIGMDRFDCRKQITTDMEAAGLLEKQEDYDNKVGYSERTNVPIEPRLSMQWFLKMKHFADMALPPVMNDELKFYPAKYKNTYRNWLENIKDWCISRQLWWGHRIPAYYLPTGGYVVAENIEEAVKLAQEKTGDSSLTASDLRQDEDALDTWFSSWLWPISLFDGINNPGNEEIKYYYPTNDLVTGPDIIFFWVARMIMAGYEYMGDMPFKNVYFTGIVRDKLGRKMSKSLGNSPDPLDLIERFGADGVRMGMMLSAPAGNDILFDEALCQQGAAFCNKIWNAFRLVSGWEVADIEQPISNKKTIAWFNAVIKETNAEIEDLFSKYRLSEALMAAFKLFTDEFSGWYLEMIKPAYQAPIDKETLKSTLSFFELLMKIIHPFMPFISEELWQHLAERKDGESIMVNPLTVETLQEEEKDLLEQYKIAKQIISGVRAVRSSKNIAQKETMTMEVVLDNPEERNITRCPALGATIKKMANLSEINYVSQKGDGSASFMVGTTEYAVPLGNLIDTAAEIEKAETEIKRLEGFLAGIMKKLSNEKFTAHAPAQVVELERKKKADAESKIASLKESVAALKK
ncbi:MAG: valine--tRNA ligase [Bacteroidaceae bacterium]|nr:valine--tRNA ligase [Bacteroidaceae bacterium]